MPRTDDRARPGETTEANGDDEPLCLGVASAVVLALAVLASATVVVWPVVTTYLGLGGMLAFASAIMAAIYTCAALAAIAAVGASLTWLGGWSPRRWLIALALALLPLLLLFGLARP